MRVINLRISGMSCVNCSNAILRVSSKLDGVKKAEVSFANSSGRFEVEDDFDDSILVLKIKKLGFNVANDDEELEKQKTFEYKKLKTRFFVAFFCTACLMGVEFFMNHSLFAKSLMLVLASIVQFYSGSYFYTHSYLALKNKNTDMNVLIALGSSSAYFYSLAAFFFEEFFIDKLNYLYFGGSSMIIMFVLFGKILEERSKQKATNYIKMLLDLSPEVAIKLQNDEEVEVLSKDLQVGDIVLVKPGQRISADGVIVFGEAEIDTSMLTGESALVLKKPQDEVHAGTFNQNGILKIQVNKPQNQTTLFLIIELLKNSAKAKMPIARIADKIASIFVPIVVLIAFFTFLVWIVATGGILKASLFAICVLVISCPCALGLATPISIVSAISNGAKNGILIKNPQILEFIKDAKYIVFDKTGTLTKGQIEVEKAECKNEDLLKFGAVALKNEHPISKAIAFYSQQKGKLETCEDFKIHIGLGIEARLNNEKILLGNAKLHEDFNVKIPPFCHENVLFGSIDGELKGVFYLKDKIRDDAKKTIDELKNLELDVILLSGDNQKAVENVANKLGINQFYHSCLPQEKHDKIAELQKNAKVIFVGDGINDSPSIKRADIGIALNAGSDIAKEAGDILLVKNNLQDIVRTIKLGIWTLQNIKQNLFWAFFYNALGIPLAAGLFYHSFNLSLNPMFASLAMSLSSTIVVLNALRLRAKKL